MQEYKSMGKTGGVSFGNRLREYRDHRGWSLGDLARATHYSRSYLSNIENGRTKHQRIARETGTVGSKYAMRRFPGLVVVGPRLL